MRNLECRECKVKKRYNCRTVLLGHITLDRLVYDFAEST